MLIGRLFGRVGKGCLITPKSGQAFPKNASDWKWLYPSIPGKLRSLHEEGYIVLFLSNQAGQPKKQDEFCNKLPQLALSLRAPFHALAAFGECFDLSISLDADNST